MLLPALDSALRTVTHSSSFWPKNALIHDLLLGLKGAKKKRMSFTTFNPANRTDNMTMLSFHRSQKAVDGASGASNPQYCEWRGRTGVGAGVAGGGLGENTCLLTNATPSSMLVFSVFERHTFLGQVPFKLNKNSSSYFCT